MAKYAVLKSNFYSLIIIASFVYIVHCENECSTNFDTVTVLNVSENFIGNIINQKVYFKIIGDHISGGIKIKITKLIGYKNSLCKDDFENYNFKEIWTNGSEGYFILEIFQSEFDEYSDLYFCLPCSKNVSDEIKWLHQGPLVFLKRSGDVIRTNDVEFKTLK